MNNQFVGQRFSPQPDSIWGDMVVYLTDIVGKRDDWYVGVDIYGRNFLSAEGIEHVFYPEDIFTLEELKSRGKQ